MQATGKEGNNPDKRIGIRSIERINFFGYIPANVRYDRNLTELSKVVYAELSARINVSGLCELDSKDIADALGRKERSVANSLEALEQGGYIFITKDSGKRLVALSNSLLASSPQAYIAPKKASKVSSEETKAASRIIDRWNELFKTKFRSTGSLVDKVCARLKVFSEDDILLAMGNRFKLVDQSDWWNKPENMHHKKNIDLLVRNDLFIEKFLNLEFDLPTKKEEQQFKPIKFQ
jgi:hypothetical protein